VSKFIEIAPLASEDRDIISCGIGRMAERQTSQHVASTVDSLMTDAKMCQVFFPVLQEWTA